MTPTTQQEDLFSQSANSKNLPLSVPQDALPPTSFATDGLSVIRRVCKAAGEEVKNLQAQLENRRKEERFLTDVLHFAESGWHFHLLELLEKEKLRITDLQNADPDLTTMLEQQRNTAKTQGENVLGRFVSLFPDECKAVGIAIDRECRHPRYTFDERFLTLEINGKKSEATLSTIEGRLGKKPADIPALVAWLCQERKRLFERKFDGNKFLKTVRKAYKAVLAKNRKNDGESVPVRDVLKRMGGKMDELNVDLSKLAHLNPQPSVDGRRIDFQQSKDTEKGMFLWKSTGGYIGFVSFKTEPKPEENQT